MKDTALSSRIRVIVSSNTILHKNSEICRDGPERTLPESKQNFNKSPHVRTLCSEFTSIDVLARGVGVMVFSHTVAKGSVREWPIYVHGCIQDYVVQLFKDYFSNYNFKIQKCGLS